MKTSKGLINTGGSKKKDRITRRTPISSINDINDDVSRWMLVAYKLDA